MSERADRIRAQVEAQSRSAEAAASAQISQDYQLLKETIDIFKDLQQERVVEWTDEPIYAEIKEFGLNDERAISKYTLARIALRDGSSIALANGAVTPSSAALLFNRSVETDFYGDLKRPFSSEMVAIAALESQLCIVKASPYLMGGGIKLNFFDFKPIGSRSLESIIAEGIANPIKNESFSGISSYNPR